MFLVEDWSFCTFGNGDWCDFLITSLECVIVGLEMKDSPMVNRMNINRRKEAMHLFIFLEFHCHCTRTVDD